MVVSQTAVLKAWHIEYDTVRRFPIYFAMSAFLLKEGHFFDLYHPALSLSLHL
jgi:hypothetical protein